jgi:6,7-dimethyl-8-ribityllumazine synthase
MAPRARIALVVSEFNRHVTARMAESARRRAQELGAKIVAEVTVPGAFDAPLAAKALALRPDVDAVVCVGAVIKGETEHDRVIVEATARSLQQVTIETMKPVTLGITGPGMTEEQAEARIDYAANAVSAALRMLEAAREARGEERGNG